MAPQTKNRAPSPQENWKTKWKKLTSKDSKSNHLWGGGGTGMGTGGGHKVSTPKAILTLFQSGQLPPWSADWLEWSPCPSLLPASPSPHAWALAPWLPGQCNLATRYSSHGWRHCNCLDFSGTVLESWERTRTVRCSWINQSRQVSKPLQMCYSYVPEREQHKSKPLLAFASVKVPLWAFPLWHSYVVSQEITALLAASSEPGLLSRQPSWLRKSLVHEHWMWWWTAGVGGETWDMTFQKGKKNLHPAAAWLQS